MKPDIREGVAPKHSPKEQRWTAAIVVVILIDVLAFAALAKGVRPAGMAPSDYVASQVAAWTILGGGLAFIFLVVALRNFPTELRRRSTEKLNPSAVVLAVRTTPGLVEFLSQRYSSDFRGADTGNALIVVIGASAWDFVRAVGAPMWSVQIPWGAISQISHSRTHFATRAVDTMRIELDQSGDPVELLIMSKRALGAIPMSAVEVQETIRRLGRIRPS